MSEGRYKERENQEDGATGGGLDIAVPDVSSIMGQLDEQIQERERVAKEHRDLMEKEDEEVKEGKKKPRQKPRGGTICFCGDPSCTIGGFVEKQGE